MWRLSLCACEFVGLLVCGEYESVGVLGTNDVYARVRALSVSLSLCRSRHASILEV